MNSSFDLKDRVAIVTGGARGIGRAVAETFVRAGAKVIVADAGLGIDGSGADPAVADEAARTIGARAFPRDIAEPDAAPALVDLALSEYGAVDVVVNNAAILRDAFIFKAKREDFEQVLQTNLTAAFALLAAATPAMREAVKQGRPAGRIVNIVSTAGLYGNFGQAAYASSKAALVGLTRVVAMDMARSGVLCNAVAPFAATRVTESIQPANEAQAQYKDRALSVPAEYVARVVGWLCAPGCTVTGQLFGVRGREVFLFSQPRPVARIVVPALEHLTPEALDSQASVDLGEHFTDLTTDLEAFNTEPLL